MSIICLGESELPGSDRVLAQYVQGWGLSSQRGGGEGGGMEEERGKVDI